MADTMRGYVPQRQIFPSIACRISSAEGAWLEFKNATADMIFSRIKQGVGERRLVEATLMGSSEARRLEPGLAIQRRPPSTASPSRCRLLPVGR